MKCKGLITLMIGVIIALLGFGLWDWKAILYPESEAHQDKIMVFGKSTESVIRHFYQFKK